MPNQHQRIQDAFLFSILALLSAAVIASTLPPASGYLGEIRRDAQGNLVALPTGGGQAAPAATVASSGLADAPAKAGTTENSSGKTIHVGPGYPVRSLAVAAKLAKDGDTVEIDPGDYVADVAVLTQDRLTLRASHGRVRLIAAGASAEGKGIWVVRGGKITIENIDFSGARVADKNGAGIRLEKGLLTIRNCSFLDNENGILAGGTDSELDIENSEFGNNGAGDGQSHNIYVGQVRRLRVVGSYFHHARIGHLLKSRARESFIAYNRLTDEIGGRASYELEFPNGGIAYVIGNIIEQGSQTDNSTIISYGAEGYAWPRNELYLVNNTIADDRPSGGIFLRVKPGLQVLKAFNNLLVGKGALEPGRNESLASSMKGLAKQLLSGQVPGETKVDGVFSNNLNVDWGVFAQASRYDYRLLPAANPVGKLVDPGTANGIKLAPQREYVHPRSSKALSKPPTRPGALQTPGAVKS